MGGGFCSGDGRGSCVGWLEAVICRCEENMACHVWRCSLYVYLFEYNFKIHSLNLQLKTLA